MLFFFEKKIEFLEGHIYELRYRVKMCMYMILKTISIKIAMSPKSGSH